MSRLLTAREIIKAEIEYRLNVLKMTKGKAAISLGYSECGFRYICKQLKGNPNYKPRLNNLGERKLEKERTLRLEE